MIHVQSKSTDMAYLASKLIALQNRSAPRSILFSVSTFLSCFSDTSLPMGMGIPCGELLSVSNSALGQNLFSSTSARGDFYFQSIRNLLTCALPTSRAMNIVTGHAPSSAVDTDSLYEMEHVNMSITMAPRSSFSSIGKFRTANYQTRLRRFSCRETLAGAKPLLSLAGFKRIIALLADLHGDGDVFEGIRISPPTLSGIVLSTQTLTNSLSLTLQYTTNVVGIAHTAILPRLGECQFAN